MALLDHLTYTTVLKLYRPTQPPCITGAGLGEFLKELGALGFLEPGGEFQARLTFGKAIDADTLLLHADDGAWDLIETGESVEELGWLLRGQDEPIYRARVRLGQVRPELLEHLAQAKRLLEGEDMHLAACSLEIGPVEALRLASDDHFMVGWMSINFTGLGHVTPWELKGFLEQAGRYPALQGLMSLCRGKWPTMGLAEGRLPRPRFPLPWDWNWGVRELAA